MGYTRKILRTVYLKKAEQVSMALVAGRKHIFFSFPIFNLQRVSRNVSKFEPIGQHTAARITLNSTTGFVRDHTHTQTTNWRTREKVAKQRHRVRQITSLINSVRAISHRMARDKANESLAGLTLRGELNYQLCSEFLNTFVFKNFGSTFSPYCPDEFV